LKLAFKLFDKDGSGGITLESLRTILSAYFSMPEADIKSFFDKIDTKQDGTITYDEFHEFAKTKPEYPKMISMLSFPEFKILKSNLELTRLSSSMSLDDLATSSSRKEAGGGEAGKTGSNSNTLTKRTKSSTDTPISAMLNQQEVATVHKVVTEQEEAALAKSQTLKRDEIKTE
jgi:hypothetical protein